MIRAVGDEVGELHAAGRIPIAAAGQGVRPPIDCGRSPGLGVGTTPTGTEGVTEGRQDLPAIIGPHDPQIGALYLIARFSRVDGISPGDSGNPGCLALRRRFSRPRWCEARHD
jgi:hypothetical protein